MRPPFEASSIMVVGWKIAGEGKSDDLHFYFTRVFYHESKYIDESFDVFLNDATEFVSPTLETV